MLTSITNLVDKARQSLTALQEKSLRESTELSQWMKHKNDLVDNDIKKRTTEIMSQTIKHTEDQVREVRQRAGKYGCVLWCEVLVAVVAA